MNDMIIQIVYCIHNLCYGSSHKLNAALLAQKRATNNTSQTIKLKRQYRSYLQFKNICKI